MAPRKRAKVAPAWLTAEALATHLNLESERRVQQLVTEHQMPRVAPGRYDREICTTWYIKYLQQCVQRRGTPAKKAPRERLLRLQADLKQIEKDRLLGNLVTLEQYRAALSLPLKRLAAAMKSAHVRHAHQVVGLADQAAARRALQSIMLQLQAEMRVDEIGVVLAEPNAV